MSSTNDLSVSILVWAQSPPSLAEILLESWYIWGGRVGRECSWSEGRILWGKASFIDMKAEQAGGFEAFLRDTKSWM